MDSIQRIANLSPEKLALLMSLLQKDAARRAAVEAIPRRPERGTFPLSFAQRRLWFLDQWEPGSPYYNMPGAVRLRGSLDIAALERSLNEIIRRHEVLRTTFSATGGEPVQTVAPEATLGLRQLDLSNLPPAEREERAQALAQTEARMPFDLAHGPVLRCLVVRLAPDDHLLVLVVHHIAGDGWSLGVFVRELAALYSAFHSGLPSPLSELPIQYGDFAVWQRQSLQGKALALHLDYWTQQLRGLPPVLQLPIARPRPLVQTANGATQRCALPKSLATRLTALAQQEDGTLFMTLLAAFQTLLYRFSDQDDICVGSPIANRNRAETEGLIGFFVNTLVLRSNLSGNPSFRDLLRRVRAVALAAYAHQDVPFEMLVEALHPERQMSHAPLFQVMFALQNAPAQPLSLPGLRLTLTPIETGTATFDITLMMEETAESLQATIEYNTDLFDADAIRRLMSSFSTLLHAVAADPDQRLDSVPLLDASERRHIIEHCNATTRRYPDDLCLHHYVEQHARHNPGAIAAVFPGNAGRTLQQLTYAQLNERANRLAHSLRRMGMGPESLVGLSLERSLDMLVAMLAVLKSGGAYVPLDPAYPPDRLLLMIRDADLPVILTTSDVAAGLPPSTARVVCLDVQASLPQGAWGPSVGQAAADLDAGNPDSGVTPDHLAYVIYTSGSTGRPKGVMVPHRAVVNHNMAVAEAFGLRPHDRVLQSATINFDGAVEEIFPTWLVGATLVLRPQRDLLTLPELCRLIASEGITILDLPTAYWHELVYALTLTDDPLPPSLRLVIIGGEKASYERYIAWARRAPGVPCLNTYGPTEGTIIATLYDPRLDATSIEQRSNVPLGRPIANVQVYVLDKNLQPTPIGVPGELCIGGAGVARGYLNSPDLTAARFVPDPFSAAAGARLYRTGDLARLLPDGNIEFAGRIDDQIKVRGYRVEPAEIEAILLQHADVREAVVLLHQDAQAVPGLVAYIVPAREPWPSEGSLHSHVAALLPDYMLPAAYVVLPQIPRLPNGKVDRKALPVPEPAAEKRPTLAPRTATEEILAGLWSQVLGVTRLSIDDDFFDLGGHSLLATQLASRIRQIFQVELPLRRIFESPTIAGLAQSIEAERRQRTVGAPPMRPVGREEEMPLSFAQQRLWFLEQYEPGSPLYNIAGAVRISGSVSIPSLLHSLNTVIQRHESLRTTFKTVDGRATQSIAPVLPITMPITDLSQMDAQEQEAMVQRMAAEEAQQPFDLAHGPLLRVHLLRLAATEHVVLVTMHHIVSDGWSIMLLIRELATIYGSAITGQPANLPDLPIQYADYAHWQRQWLQGDAIKPHLDYWKNELGGLPTILELPSDRPRPPVQTYRGATYHFLVPEDLASAAAGMSRQQGATLFMTLLAAFQAVLHRYTGQEHIVVGSPIANRNRAETENLIGFFVNTLVLHAHVSDDMTFRDLIAQVRAVTLEAYSHQDVPFEILVDALQPHRDASHSPIVQVVFAMQDRMPDRLELPGLTIQPMDVDTKTAKFDLTMFIDNEAGTLHGFVEYNTDLFDASTIARLVGHFQTLLASASADPDRSISRLDMLTEAERRQLLTDWNATAAHYPLERCVHQMVADQATLTPDALAVSSGDLALTYRELNERGNQLAHYLARHGVGPETLVALCTERSIHLVVAALGVLKAGGAYVPMDPTYPKERLAYMLAETHAPVLLTQKHLLSRMPDHQAQSICLDADWPKVAQESRANPATSVTARNLAYLIYTSGSTGQPKGVQIEHRSLLNLVYWTHNAFQVSPHDRSTLIAGPGFDASVWETWSYLTKGASVFIPGDDLKLAPEELRDWLVANAITVSFAPTPVAERLLALEWPPGTRLRILHTGGDRLHYYPSPTLPFALVNNYGPTEYTVITTSGRVPPGRGNSVAPSIGWPVANTRVYILDAQQQPQPIGIPGELHVAGHGLARGYLGRPDLTSEKFVPDPFGTEPGARMYKTGDLVRYLADGQIEFLGRMDFQVKLHGFRIELGEIEAVLTQHPAVKEAAVLLREDTPGMQRLVAYIVAKPNENLELSNVRAFVSARLPGYMVPSVFTEQPSIPTTANGKVDRRALPQPVIDAVDLENPYVAPRTPTEETLTRIWADVLHLPRVGVHDNFFELGGDSILSIQIIARAKEVGLHLSPKQIFQTPTVAGLAAAASKLQAAKAEQGVIEGPVPLTPIQRWFFEQALPDPHHWNQSVLLQATGPINPELLAQAVQRVLAHHDALRLRFELGADGARQTCAGIDDAVPFTVVDLSDVAHDAVQERLREHIAQAQASLDLARGPLLRVVFFRPTKYKPALLLLVIHHLAIDGVSWRVLLTDLMTVYQQLVSGEAVRLPAKTTSYKEWASRLLDYARSDEVRRQADYWLNMLTMDHPFHLPLDHQTGPNDEASARSEAVTIDAHTTRVLLSDVPSVFGAEMNHVLLAALAQSLTRWTGMRSLLVDLESHGRIDTLDGIDLSRTVGWFTSLYPLRLDVDSDPAAVLISVKEQVQRVPDQGVSYGLLRCLSPDAALAARLRAAPRADISFNYLGQFDQQSSDLAAFILSAEPAEPERSPRALRPHVLDVSGRILEGKLRIEWAFSQNLHRPATIQRLATSFVESLHAIADYCRSARERVYTPSDFPDAGLTQDELSRIRAEVGN